MRANGYRQRSVAMAVTAVMLGVFAATSAQSATCKDELDRFEFRLNGSSLAESDPDTFKALVRQAEEAAELRDEQQCLQAVAALHDVIPAEPEAQTGLSAPASAPSRPSAPVLIVAGGDDEADEVEQEPQGVSPEDDRTLND